MRVSFNKVFRDNGDGSYTLKRCIKIGRKIGTKAIFRKGVEFAGVEVAKYAGRDLEVEQYLDGILEIKGAY